MINLFNKTKEQSIILFLEEFQKKYGNLFDVEKTKNELNKMSRRELRKTALEGIGTCYLLMQATTDIINAFAGVQEENKETVEKAKTLTAEEFELYLKDITTNKIKEQVESVAENLKEENLS